MIKAFIVDLDGVLISTDKYHYLDWKNIADKPRCTYKYLAQ